MKTFKSSIIEIGRKIREGEPLHLRECLDSSEESDYEIGAIWQCGVMYEDGWGSWGVDLPNKKTIVHVDNVIKTFSVEEVYQILQDEYGIDYCGVGQPDGPGSEGQIWASRLYRQKNGEMVGGTHMHDDLDQCISHLIIDYFYS